jgi:hypothetical protein
MFNRQEARMERSFYRALHELQRLRKERESNLASVLQATHSPSVSAGADLPNNETNDIQPPPSRNPRPRPRANRNPDPPALPPPTAPSSRQISTHFRLRCGYTGSRKCANPVRTGTIATCPVYVSRLEKGG